MRPICKLVKALRVSGYGSTSCSAVEPSEAKHKAFWICQPLKHAWLCFNTPGSFINRFQVQDYGTGI